MARKSLLILATAFQCSIGSQPCTVQVVRIWNYHAAEHIVSEIATNDGNIYYLLRLIMEVISLEPVHNRWG